MMSGGQIFRSVLSVANPDDEDFVSKIAEAANGARSNAAILGAVRPPPSKKGRRGPKKNEGESSGILPPGHGYVAQILGIAAGSPDMPTL